ncbi:hypothetical protein P7G51_02225 [Enterococcus asini]|uniref:hypothetical protein n=1 Tax=Enterococcus TaxID=1350 RepID=UPI0028906FC0|nr:hypothetical protein [Enterococcus asini]MDT2756204.1 hypothetical protein [Enterococcus asini]
MTDQQTKIDPEKFAYHFMEMTQPTAGISEDMEAAAKKALAAYLAGYYLIQKFNHLENDFFVEDHGKPISKYQRILSELNNY